MKGLGLFPIIIAAAIILAAVIGGSLYWYFYEQQSRIGIGKPVGPETEKFFDEVAERMQMLPPGAPMREFRNADTSTSSISSLRDWKTYRNEKYGFEVGYPLALCHNDSSSIDGFVNFSQCPYNDSASIMIFDSICVFATGFEYATKMSSTTERVTFGSNEFIEQKTYADDELVLDIISIDFPISSNQWCKRFSLILRKSSIIDFRDNLIPQILSTFKFIK